GSTSTAPHPEERAIGARLEGWHTAPALQQPVERTICSVCHPSRRPLRGLLRVRSSWGEPKLAPMSAPLARNNVHGARAACPELAEGSRPHLPFPTRSVGKVAEGRMGSLPSAPFILSLSKDGHLPTLRVGRKMRALQWRASGASLCCGRREA